MNVSPLSLTSADTGATSRADEAAKRAASQFEALFLSKLATVSKTSDDEEDGDIFRSDATDQFQQMFGEQLGTTMADAGGIGLADIVLRQIRENRGEKAGHGTVDVANGVRPLKPEDFTRVMARADGTSATTALPRRGTLLPRTDAVPTNTQTSSNDLLSLPVSGRISSGFGAHRRHHTHQGIDIAVARGTKIKAASEGKVVFAGRQRGYGNTVVIEHDDGRRTRYAHADRLSVSAGDTVAKGETIGRAGSTGRSTGPHVHFEVVQAGRHVNPLKAVARDEAIARSLETETPTLARAAEAAGSILTPTTAVGSNAVAPTPALRSSVILPAGAVRTASAEVVVPDALGRHPRFETTAVSLSLPVRGRVSSSFGARRDPFTGRRRVHEGVDIAVPKGTPIRAAAEGTVVFAGRQRGYGNTVILQHADGRKTRYAHAAKLGVTVGEAVGKGETIGLVGSTGRSTGPHLHFEVIDGGRHVNPLGAVAHDARLADR